MKNLELRRDECGVSLIALVITIIVIIILAAIAFNSSTGTIGKANYSKFVSNISEVEQAINEKMVTVKGAMLAKGSQITDGQVFNYIAKGGKTENDFVVESKTPDYTIIEKNADIGIKLPVMKVNTPNETNVEVKYAVTKNGKVFIWPPYPSENAYNIRDKEFVDSSLVSSSGDIDITVAGATFKLQINDSSKLENRELLDDGLSKKEFEEIKEKVKVGDYVNYTPTSATVQTDPSKTGYATIETLTTDTSAKWRIFSIDEETGKILITTQGPVNALTLTKAEAYIYGVNEIDTFCNKLYSNVSKRLFARSMIVEDIDNECGYVPTESSKLKYAYYPNKTQEEYLKDVKIGEKVYRAKKLYGNSDISKFYTWDDKNGITYISKSKEEYNNAIYENNLLLVSGIWYAYSPKIYNKLIGEILSDSTGWLGSRMLDLITNPPRFNIVCASSEALVSHSLIFASGESLEYSHGLRPVISFNINQLDISDITKDGSELAEWDIK